MPSGLESSVPQDFSQGWRFALGTQTRAEDSRFDDTGWRLLDLPHDWSIEAPAGAKAGDGPLSQATPEGPNVGWLRGGTGWYRKHFSLREPLNGKELTLVFDGIQQDCEVWVNGHHLSFQPHGYIPFQVEIAPFIRAAGEDNVIAVKALNPEANTRWYAGSGIYRSPTLRFHDPLHLPLWGTHVDTVFAEKGKARLQFQVAVQNDRPAGEELELELTLESPSGERSVHSLGKLFVAAGGLERVNQSVAVEDPRLWSPDAPQLYSAELRIVQQGLVVDRTRLNLGIRTVSVSAETGLLLNGVPVKLRGACLHHDNGLLGAAAFPDAEYRRVALMKRNGFNAIRTSHNPPSAAFLDACDRLGVLVVDEFADHWELPKKPNGYQRYFSRHWEKDLGAMIARDFNHPSVVIWSIGNEIEERFSPRGVELGRQLAAFVHARDARRPVTNAVNPPWERPSPGPSWEINDAAFGVLDIGGYNYAWEHYESDHRRFPQRVMMGTESYPKEAFENWRSVLSNTQVLGDFVWTGMDHLGESGIGHTFYMAQGQDPKTAPTTIWGLMPFPWHINWSGDIDLVGNKKPQSLYRDVVWGLSPVELLVHEPVAEGNTEQVGLWGWPAELPSWNWTGAGKRPLKVSVYSRAPRVRLELNGRLIGEQEIDQGKGIRAEFEVPYEPGTLSVQALDHGKELGRKELVTTGAPASLRLSPESTRAKAERGAVVFVPIEVLDAKGRVVPDAALPLSLQVEGEAELKAFGSADPADPANFLDAESSSFRGRALAILRSTGKPGRATLRLTAPGLAQATVSLEFSP